MKFKGKVFKGKREGSATGYPTANIEIQQNIQPGIYTGYAGLSPGDKMESVIYIAGGILECHILDFSSKDLYGNEISVEISHKLRDAKKFSNLEEARQQIKKDEHEARKWFSNASKK